MYRVVIIDDEEIIREGLRCTVQWQQADCEVIGEAADGLSGVELVKNLQPDIVLTDIRMPGMTGLEMVTHLKTAGNSARVLIMTGFRDFEYAQEAVRLGAFRLLLKPMQAGELEKALEDACMDIARSRMGAAEVENLRKKVRDQFGIPSQERKVAAHGEESSFLATRAVRYMKEHFNEDLCLSRVAEHLYVSTWHLSKTLKKETGENFTDILNQLRIEEAKRLLDDPAFKIYEVASRVGIEDIPYFTRIFKKISGQTPTEYKNTRHPSGKGPV